MVFRRYDGVIPISLTPGAHSVEELSLSTEVDSNHTVRSVEGITSQNSVLGYFSLVNKRLVQQGDIVPQAQDTDGELEKWYSLDDIKESDRIANEFQDIIQEPLQEMLSKRHGSARDSCARESGGNSVLDTGGWCLAPGGGGANDIIEYGKIKFSIPQNHVSASKRISSELLAFIDKEGIKSVNDFGAGVGQYKHAILSK